MENTPKKSKAKHDETDVLDTMITSLAELLEEKGVITQEEWEQRIKKNLR
ncbi:MAG: hypothetical protein OK422_04255 [Thaumarchaeota archaeon]|nr:hypothetical protein [Nitrososphaerota archaeon]